VIRLIYCLRRRAGVTLGEFHEHWLEHHVERYGRPLLQIRRYVLYAAVEPQPVLTAHGPDPYDGIATVWMDDLATLRATMDSAMIEAGQDERLFIDHDRSRAALSQDEVIVEPDAPSPIVLFECLTRRPGISPAQFREQWRAHGATARGAYDRGLLQGYIQSHLIGDPQGGVDRFDELGDQAEQFDGIGAAYFQSAVLARHFLEVNGGLPSWDATCVDHARTASMLARRHPRRDPIR
jgi:EthD domain